MAPGVKGANRTGRPFTGDHAELLLYQTLLRFGFADGQYLADPADGLALRDCRVTNAVRCVPPANLPTNEETRTCNRFLAAEIGVMPNLRAILALGVLAHTAVLRAVRVPAAQHRFAHGGIAILANEVVLASSYHVSRYNTNTGRLTGAMFNSVFEALLERLNSAEPNP